ncbi:MAG: caspase family protein [Bacteroidia bacterium]|nr:caspase family protein [Bacteroidia bacterium]
MNRLFISLFFTLLLWSEAFPQETFTQIYGGKQDEHAMSVIQARDGNYVLVGFTFSYGKGKSDVWVMKVDRYGEEIWRRFLGTSDFDWPNTLIETRDGNYVIAGYTRNSTDGQSDAWIFQLNSFGEGMWSKTFGGNLDEEAKSITQTADGGFAITGFSYSNSKGESDVWLLRLNAVGEELWQQTYGGEGVEMGYSIIETRDSGFLMGGYQSYDSVNRADMLLIKVDRKGKGVWRRVLRSPGNDITEVVHETPEGDFIAGGWAFMQEKGDLDGKVVRLTAGGKVLWEKTYGGDGKDAFYDMVPASGGGFIFSGQTGSFSKNSDVWILCITADGVLQWQKRSDGGQNDYGHAITQTRDGGFVIAGGTKSYQAEGSDMYLLKTDAMGNFGEGPLKGETITANDSPLPPTSSQPDIFKPNLYILAMGVSEYQDPSVSLNYAHSDAAALADKFASLEGLLYNKVEVRKYLNKEATLVNIKTGISWLEKEATQKDMILVFISSHGALDNKGNLYILPTDFDANNLFATALNIRDLTEGMNGTPCKKLIFLDACHSGQSGYDLFEFASIKALHINKAVDELMAKEPGVTVMTSSSGKEFSYENPVWKHGAFTKAILEGLNGQADFNKDRVINLFELNLYVTERVKELTAGRQHPFTPINLFGDIPLFVLD